MCRSGLPLLRRRSGSRSPSIAPDFAHPPKLAQHVLVQPGLELLGLEAAELGAAIVPFADDDGFGNLGEPGDQSLGMRGDNELRALRRIQEEIGDVGDNVGVQPKLGLFDADQGGGAQGAAGLLISRGNGGFHQRGEMQEWAY